MPWASLVVAIVLALGAGGCGDDGFANGERAPKPITLGVSVTPSKVTVSPSSIGAGPVELIVSNLTPTSQQVTLRSESLAGGGALLEQRTGPINPRDTASLTADLVPGNYRLTVRPGTIAPARIRVGRSRPSAQDDVLQP